ncbi:RDD family protein [Sphingomonas sp. 3-13AW]|uniref:RDD family protein n=1 Tax=Sphingomonas sp. 3-13AW TaxID=3050450 RepID=UPI003BB61B6B
MSITLAKTENDTDAASVPLARPWPRYWARSLDLAVWSTIAGIVVAFAFPDFAAQPAFEGKGGTALFGLVMTPIALLFEAVVLAAFGNTPGKALAGIKVRVSNDRQIPFAVALRRNLQLYVYGLAFGIPIFVVIAALVNYRKVDSGSLVSWDSANDTRVINVSSNLGRTFIVAVIALAMHFGAVALTSLEDSGAGYSTAESTEYDTSFDAPSEDQASEQY